MKEDRFHIIYKQSTSWAGGGVRILVDTETGVQYLYHFDGYGGGLTVLTGVDGKPLLYHEGQTGEGI